MSNQEINWDREFLKPKYIKFVGMATKTNFKTGERVCAGGGDKYVGRKSKKRNIVIGYALKETKDGFVQVDLIQPPIFKWADCESCE